jgi:plasmid stabilization system protein ParE
MTLTVKKITWSANAKAQLKSAYDYIRKDSPKNAVKVRSDIAAITKMLPLHPEIYSLDKYKEHNDGSYRAFEKHHYRVTYRILEKEILILRIRHTGMEPLIF